MKIRKFVPKDFITIKRLYSQLLNFEVTKQIYDFNYFNKDLNDYTSLVVDIDNKVVGHNALIINEYKIANKKTRIGLSSGGMLIPEFGGLFYQLLKKCFTCHEVDFIIAFPNNNSLGFFEKILKFNVLKDNYFVLNKDNYYPNIASVSQNLIHRPKSFISKRIFQHPYYKYKEFKTKDNHVIYKIYNKTSIDILYVENFGVSFTDFIRYILSKYNKINIVHWDVEYMNSLGFKTHVNNAFVYKNMNNIKVDFFQPQMIDSDVF